MPPETAHQEQRETHHEASASDHHSSRNRLTEHALTLYQCPDGSLVTHPSQCKEGKVSELNFNDIFKQLG